MRINRVLQDAAQFNADSPVSSPSVPGSEVSPPSVQFAADLEGDAAQGAPAIWRKPGARMRKGMPRSRPGALRHTSVCSSQAPIPTPLIPMTPDRAAYWCDARSFRTDEGWRLASDIITVALSFLDPSGLKVAFVVCEQWRFCIERDAGLDITMKTQKLMNQCYDEVYDPCCVGLDAFESDWCFADPPPSAAIRTDGWVVQHHGGPTRIGAPPCSERCRASTRYGHRRCARSPLRSVSTTSNPWRAVWPAKLVDDGQGIVSVFHTPDMRMAPSMRAQQGAMVFSYAESSVGPSSSTGGPTPPNAPPPPNWPTLLQASSSLGSALSRNSFHQSALGSLPVASASRFAALPAGLHARPSAGSASLVPGSMSLGSAASSAFLGLSSPQGLPHGGGGGGGGQSSPTIALLGLSGLNNHLNDSTAPSIAQSELLPAGAQSTATSAPCDWSCRSIGGSMNPAIPAGAASPAPLSPSALWVRPHPPNHGAAEAAGPRSVRASPAMPRPPPGESGQRRPHFGPSVGGGSGR